MYIFYILLIFMIIAAIIAMETKNLLSAVICIGASGTLPRSTRPRASQSSAAAGVEMSIAAYRKLAARTLRIESGMALFLIVVVAWDGLSIRDSNRVKPRLAGL